MKKVVLATRNKDKIKEIKKIFEIYKCNIELLTLSNFCNIPEIEEDGKTLKDNAIKKAKIVGNFTGLPSLSEDTGLFVDYLNGAPGIYSARYADPDPKHHTCSYEDNCKKLLKELEGVPWEKRTAKFVCVAALYLPEKNKCYTRIGEVRGYISLSLQGNNGFGYDPVFFYPEKEKNFAEMSIEEKCLISHRARAIAKIISLIKSLNQQFTNIFLIFFKPFPTK